MVNYPGLKNFIGCNGCYRVNQDGEDLTIDIYLVSVPSFVEKNGKWIMSDPSHRDYPDISFVIDNDEDYWTIVSMEVPSFGMDGVNEFVLALMQYQDRCLSQVDELLPVITELLDQKGVVWGRPPADLEATLGVHKKYDTITFAHPGI